MAIGAVPSFQQKMIELKQYRDQRVHWLGKQRSVVILGGGTAGLIRAIESLVRNHRTIVIEKRSEESGLYNTVALNQTTIPILQQYGIYQWLEERKLIYPYKEAARPYLSVRLRDLQAGMKAVLQELSPEESIIRYKNTVANIDQSNPKAKLTLQTEHGAETIQEIDLLVNAEGSRSSTNRLLQISRRNALPSVPVVSAIFQDNRSSITGIGSFFVYIADTLAQCAVSIYYYAIFFFKFIFQGERFCNQNRVIAGALILKTPGQNYLGFGFNKEQSEKLLKLKKQMEEKKVALKNATCPEIAAQLQKESARAEKDYQSFAHYWINLSFCAANFYGVVAKIFGESTYHSENASRLPLRSFSVYDIGADRAEVTHRMLNQTPYIVCGDALATVDPTTGLGANTAITTISQFKSLVEGIEYQASLEYLLRSYDRDVTDIISKVHHESRLSRYQYRPDVV